MGLCRAAVLFFAAGLCVMANPSPSAADEVYKHPFGYFFRYPDGWTLQETEDALVLVPGDAVRDGKGELMELVVVGGEEAPGIQSASDPRVAEFFDLQYRSTFPSLARTGETEEMETGLGPGVVFTYEGEVEGGVTSIHRVHVVVRHEAGLFLVHMARSDLSAGRQEEVAGIFSGFGRETPVVDPELVRQWTRSDFEGSSDMGGQLSATTSMSYEFFADGTVLYGSRTRMSGNTNGLGVVIDGDGGPNLYRGRFTTSGNVLTMVWEGGSEEVYEYRVFLDHEGTPSLKLVADGRKPQYWQ